MRKGLTLALVIVMVLVSSGPVWAQGGGPGPAAPSAGEQQGPGAPPEVSPVGPGDPPESAPQGPVGPRVETREPAQTRTQEQAGDLTRVRDRDQEGTREPLEEPLVTRTRTRLQICDEECVPEDLGLMSQFRSWMRLHVPALVQMRLLGVVPFSMSGTAVIDEGELIFDLENGNRWAEELMDSDTTLITTDALVKAIYPDTSTTVQIITWAELVTILDEYPDSYLMILGYVAEDGTFVATRIQIRVL